MNFQNNCAVVVTYNRKLLLSECVQSLMKQTHQYKKIIIIDNHSSDGTEELFTNEIYSNNDKIKYVRLESNFGGARGFYEGIKLALCEDVEWVTLLDDDAIMDYRFLEEVNIGIAHNPEVKAFSGTVITDGIVDINHRRRVINEVTLKQVVVDPKEYENDYFIYDIFSFVGCIINMDIIRKIGLPEKDFFIWYDDTEYSFRVRKYSKIVNVNKALIFHKTKLVTNTKKYKPAWKDYYGTRNLMFVIKKHSSIKVLGTIFVYIKLIKACFSSFLGSRYSGNRRYYNILYLTVIKDVINNKKGKNINYLP